VLRAAGIFYTQFIAVPCGSTYKPSIRQKEQRQMWIMVVYLLIVVVCELVVVAIGLALDRIAPFASLPVSLTLFFAVLWFGWLLAVRWTEPRRGKKSKLVTGN
jgi:uncharacterized membrane protein YphA (DoxX/SURF4 family)